MEYISISYITFHLVLPFPPILQLREMENSLVIRYVTLINFMRKLWQVPVIWLIFFKNFVPIIRLTWQKTDLIMFLWFILTNKQTDVSIFYVYPRGLRDVLVYTKQKYKNPTIYITECGERNIYWLNIWIFFNVIFHSLYVILNIWNYC